MALRGWLMSTVLFKTIRTPRSQVNKATALIKHDLLLDDVNKRKQNRNTTDSILNTYKFRGELLETVEQRKSALQEIEKVIFSKKSDLAPEFDFTKYSKTKAKIKRWSQAENIDDDERVLFKKILSVIDDKDSHFDTLFTIESLKALGKIKRYNDKRRAIETIGQLHNERKSLSIDESSKLNTGIESVILKVPAHNEQKLSGAQLESLLIQFYQENYPDYPILLSVVHRDEGTEHAHLTIHAQNQKTLKYDFVQNQYESVKDSIQVDTELPERYSDIENTKVLTAVGEAIQNKFYRFINENQNIVKFEKKQYIDAEAKAAEREIIKRDTSKRMADREFNTANYYALIKNKLEQEALMAKEHTEELEQHQVMAEAALDVKLRKLKGVEQDLSKSQESVTGNAKTIEQQEKRLNNIQASIQNAKNALRELMVNATNYAHSVKEETLRNIKANFKTLQKLPGTFAQEGHHQAREMQPTDQQKQDIDNAYAERFKP